MAVEYIDPVGLLKSRGFTQVITINGPNKTIYVGGQDAVNEKGETVGKGNLKQQTQQVLANIEKALEPAGAKLENVVKWNVYIVEGQNLREGFAAFAEKWGNKPNPPTLTGLFVSGLANPDWLVEMDAIAVVPE